jgi:MYXO-CTERM domain-containing protein
MSKRMTSVALAVVMVLGLVGSAAADVTALKRDAGLTDDGGISTVFKDAIGDASIVVHTDATSASGDVVDDSGLWNGTTGGDARWSNIGMHDRSYNNGPVLIRFAVEELPGLAGGTINSAQLRLYYESGNSGVSVSYITSTAWSEGNKGSSTGSPTYGYYPGTDQSGSGGTGPALGVSRAHPNGLNTSGNQDFDGSVGGDVASWGDGDDFWTNTGDGSVADERAAASHTAFAGSNLDEGAMTYDGFAVWNVTDLVQLWADGTPNYGFYTPDRVNRTYQMSETPDGVNFQPVLFIDYEKAPEPIAEPAGLGLIGLALLGLRKRRRTMKTLCAFLLVGLMLAGPVMADSSLVALKRDAGLSFAVDIAGDTTVDNDTVTPVKYQAATVQTVDVADTSLWWVSGARWRNFGDKSPLTSYNHIQLFKFDVSAIQGTVTEAVLRYASKGGNQGDLYMGPIRSYDWAEGDRNDDYPGNGAEPGASWAHPAGVNTGASQDYDGSVGGDIASWGDGNDFFYPDPVVDATVPPRLGYDVSPSDASTPGDGSAADEVTPTSTGYLGGDFSRWWNVDITDIVTDWVSGAESNYGLYLIRRAPGDGLLDDHNWNILSSEEAGGLYGAAWAVEPVLFIEYTPPVAEPAGLSLMGLALLGLRRRRS